MSRLLIEGFPNHESGFVSGHDFSRAEIAPQMDRALAPATTSGELCETDPSRESSFEGARLQPCHSATNECGALAPEGSSFVSGHDFSRAVTAPKINGALAPEPNHVEAKKSTLNHEPAFVSGHDFSRAEKSLDNSRALAPEAQASADDDPKLREHCGVVAIHGHPDAARQVYLGLYALQHRGQESAGIATADGTHLSNIKGMGLVSEIFTDDVLARLKGDMAIGHTRYSTTGDSALLNAQPIRVESTKGLIAIAHNGNLVNLGNLRVHLERQGAFFQTTSDSEIIVQLIAHSQATTLVDAIADSLRQVEGAFSIVMMTRDRVFAARDPHGFRPLSMGRITNPDGPDTIVFASETCAFDLLRAKFERDVLPGELVMVSADGVTSRQFAPPNQTSCIFEHVYFARPDSMIFNRWVQESREEMGRQLARESHVPADLVVPVPDSGVTAAIGYAAESGIPFRFGLIRNHYVGRTFIEPEQRVRDFGVKLKLNPVRNLLEGRRIILIDDSIIRGTTSRKIVRMVRQAGASEVHLRISCPPTISPCFYGVDTPRKSELIAANNSVEEIRQYIEADSLAYLSLEGLQKACDGGEGNHYCVACYTGEYPTQWVDVEDILPAAAAVR